MFEDLVWTCRRAAGWSEGWEWRKVTRPARGDGAGSYFLFLTLRDADVLAG